MLILFDIDMTLITTGGAGMTAIQDAGRELFGPSFTSEGVSYGGRLDPIIIADLFSVNGIDPTEASLTALRRGYAQRLATVLDSAEPGSVTALPGVHALLERLRAEQDAGELCLGLLTGNFAETGSLKLKRCGIDPNWFPCRVWGDDSPHRVQSRDHLPQVAMDRHIEMFSRPIDPGRVIVVGDTVHDVRCALVNQCRVLGVATGYVSAADLEAAGAHRVVADLSDTDDIGSWLLDPSPSAPVVR